MNEGYIPLSEETIPYRGNHIKENSPEYIDELNITLTKSLGRSINSGVGVNTTFRTFLLQRAAYFIGEVPNHWLDQEQPSETTLLVISIVFLIICIPGNISQLLVIIAYGRARKLRTASNRLLLSLLIADFILLVNCYTIVYQTLKGAPVFGAYGCQYYGFTSTLAALAEIWSLAAVSCDRLQAIFNPLDRQKRITKSQANGIVLFVWCFSLLFAIFPLVGWNNYVSESYFIGCSFNAFSQSWSDRSYIITLIVFAWMVPTIMIFISHVAILYRVQMEEMLAKMVCLLMCIWFIAWTPYAAMSVWIMFLDARGLTPILGIVPTLCCKISAGTNAMLYGLRLPKFKKEIRNMIFSALPSFIIENTCLNQFVCDKRSDMFISNGGIVSSSVFGKLEKHSSIKGFTRSESFGTIRRRSFAAASRLSTESKLNKKLSFSKSRKMNRRHTMIPGHIEMKKREMIENNGGNTPPAFHRPQRMDSITESKMETTNSSLTNCHNSKDSEMFKSSENLSYIFKGIMKNGHNGSKAIVREISFIDDGPFKDNEINCRIEQENVPYQEISSISPLRKSSVISNKSHNKHVVQIVSSNKIRIHDAMSNTNDLRNGKLVKKKSLPSRE